MTRGRQDQEARSHRSATGGKYVIGNFEENGKKYRESPEKREFRVGPDWSGPCGAVMRNPLTVARGSLGAGEK